ncbi:DUF1080 domain-containing protein [Verrucomicrobia bacterium S94]|nr:DUF1080 domain-containing protein [Verrucomicrobia bacterium S94]
MKHTAFITALFITVSGWAAPQGFTALFDGHSARGWKGALDGYRFENGTIQCRKNSGGVLFTEKEYSNFIVEFEFRLPPGGNNGLAIRYPGYGDTAYVGMCELQILDNSAKRYEKLDPRQYHGSAYGMAAAKRGYLKPAGEWNFQRVEVIGSTIKVILNGTLILDTDLSQITEYQNNKPHPGKNRTSGHFGFAGHRSPVAFRNIYIKDLTHE